MAQPTAPENPPEAATLPAGGTPRAAPAETSTREPEPRKPSKAKLGRPRRPIAGREGDRRIFDAWKTGDHPTFRALAEAFGMSERVPEVRSAFDRERKRQERERKRRDGAPDKNPTDDPCQ